jgi:hypothetical protein
MIFKSLLSLKSLLGLTLALSSATGQMQHMPVRLEQQIGMLEGLPLPVLLPESLSEAYELNNVRLQALPHPIWGHIQSWTVVFVSPQQSFMLQSRPLGYAQAKC